jgi:hypothetical protein
MRYTIAEVVPGDEERGKCVGRSEFVNTTSCGHIRDVYIVRTSPQGEARKRRKRRNAMQEAQGGENKRSLDHGERPACVMKQGEAKNKY